MNGQWLRARQTKYAAYATVYILVVAGDRRGGERARQPLQQVLRLHLQQALYALRSDRQDRQGPQAGRHHHLLRPDQPFPAGQGPARPVRQPFHQGSRRVRRSRQDPEVARAANIRDYGTAIVQVGDKKNKPKASPKRASPARSSAISKAARARSASSAAAASARSTTPTATASRTSRICWPRTATRPSPSACCKRPTCPPTAPCSSSAVPSAIICSRGRCHQEVCRGRRPRALHAGPAAQVRPLPDCRQRCAGSAACRAGA